MATNSLTHVHAAPDDTIQVVVQSFTEETSASSSAYDALSIRAGDYVLTFFLTRKQVLALQEEFRALAL